MDSIGIRLQHAHKLFSKSNWKIVTKLMENSTFCDFSPILTLDLTEYCNFRCPFCIDGRITQSDVRQEIEWVWLERELPQFKKDGCRAIELSGGGEPTSYSHFEEFVAMATTLDYRLALITNGTGLARYYDTILNGNFDWIRVSLNAACTKTHQEFHQIHTDLFYDIIESIRNLAPWKCIGISFIVDENNVSELYAAATLSKDIGSQYIEIKPKVLSDNKGFISYQTFQHKLREEVQKAQMIQNDSFSVLLTQSMQDIIDGTLQNPHLKSVSQCYACYLRTLLTPTSVYPCTYYRGSYKYARPYYSSYDIIQQRNELINSINPCRDCEQYCARDECNKTIDSLFVIKQQNPTLFSYLGWPVDYGEDSIWL